MAKTLNLSVDQGSDWTVNTIAYTSNGTATINLWNYAYGTSQIRKSYASTSQSANIIVNIHASNTTGLVMLSMNNIVTSALAGGRYLWDATIASNTQVTPVLITRIYEGIVTVASTTTDIKGQTTL